jgi:hypothetical protein
MGQLARGVRDFQLSFIRLQVAAGTCPTDPVPALALHCHLAASTGVRAD